MITAAAFITLLQSGPTDRFAAPAPRFANSATGTTETPLPVGVFPTFLADRGTMPTVSAPSDAGDTARQASRYVQALAVIPISADADREIDRLLNAQALSAKVKRPVPRKR